MILCRAMLELVMEMGHDPWLGVIDVAIFHNCLVIAQAKIKRELIRVYTPATATGSVLTADAVHLMVCTLPVLNPAMRAHSPGT